MAPKRSVLLALTDTHHGFFKGAARYAREHRWHVVADMIYTAKIPVGWRGDGIGFDCDMITGGVVAMAYDDEFHVLFAPLSVPSSKNKFVVRLTFQCVTVNGLFGHRH